MALINHLGEELPDRWLYPQPETDAMPAPYTVVPAEALQGLERRSNQPSSHGHHVAL